jgi:Tol biopolymer transport system component
MKWFWRVILAVVFLALAAGAGYLYLQFQLAPVNPADLATTVLVPDSSVSAPSLDSRLAGLPTRADGARLLWENPESQTILAVAFVDNGSLVISATGSVNRIFALDLATRQVTHELDSAVASYTSDSRPLNRNADAFCYSAPTPPRNTMEIWCLDAAWGNPDQPRRLTHHDGTEDLVNPTINPDGSTVALEVVAKPVHKNGQPVGTIWSIGLDGSGLKQLTRGADDRNPTWTDDGTRIYFQRRLPDGSWDAYSMVPDGSNPTPVLQTFGRDERWPVAVPQTDEIALINSASDTSARVRLLNVETKAGEWLTGPGLGPESLVSISPDGKLASFVAPADASATSTRMGVWLMPLASRP